MFLTEVTEATGSKHNKIIMPRSNFQTTICQPAHLFNSYWSVCVSERRHALFALLSRVFFAEDEHLIARNSSRVYTT